MHDLDSPNGERSPHKAMYELDAWTLLPGVGHNKSTILHLAEHRSGTLTGTVRNGAPLRVDGRRRWVEYAEIVVQDGDFDHVETDFARAAGLERSGLVGSRRPGSSRSARWSTMPPAGSLSTGPKLASA